MEDPFWQEVVIEYFRKKRLESNKTETLFSLSSRLNFMVFDSNFLNNKSLGWVQDLMPNGSNYQRLVMKQEITRHVLQDLQSLRTKSHYAYENFPLFEGTRYDIFLETINLR
ncbi:hypothetical protein TNCT_458611 [Trichonephila clavata]|uniref:Uncharacterized protein n=1 Tax=Trichonephila clavata TaxID=2740835 RepID=A0A8X6HVX6_TRICU|nr:hypothetical protein TNCT_458611 [Trichonephila clavata]